MRRSSNEKTGVSWRVIISGAGVSLISCLVMCASTAVIVINEYFPEKWTNHMVISILMVSAFLGARNSNRYASRKNFMLSILTGTSFFLCLFLINMTFLNEKCQGFVYKGLAIAFGTLLANLIRNVRGRGKATVKHRHNR